MCIAACGHCAANVAALAGRSITGTLVCILRVCIAVCDHCAANVAALGGRSKPERLCAFCVCALLLVTTALLTLQHCGDGVNRNACVHFTCVCALRVCIAACDHCAANVATLGGRSKPDRLCILRVCIAACDHCSVNVATFWGRSKPERLCAFCMCALLLVTTALLMLPHWVGAVNRNAWRSKPERFCAFCVCVCVRVCVCAFATCDRCAANVAALGGGAE